MTATGYPVFAGGMTLTKDDLNTLREFLDVQDAALGRLIGFGIACGLDGTLSGTTLRIAPGAAIDQDGRPLVLDTASTIRIGDELEKFSFVDEAEGGVTPVLVCREQDQAAPECGDSSCDPHAPLRLRSARIVLAKGRLRLGAAEFATDPLLRLTPMTATAKGVFGKFDVILDTVLQRLDDSSIALHKDARLLLERLELTGLPAVKVYKAAFVNQVLFATIELMRCLALRRGTCLPDEATPGVALGWATKAGGWDCAYRHAFIPSDGLSMALLGGRCGDPCALLVDRIEAILDGYQEPATPGPKEPGTKPPKVEGIPYYPPVKDPFGGWKPGRATVPEHVPLDYLDDYLLRPEKHPWVDPLHDPWEEFGNVDDLLNVGTVGVEVLFGTDAAAAETVLRQKLQSHVTQPDVLVVDEQEVLTTEGFTPEFNIAVGDRFVLVQDELGKVVGTGRVPVRHTLQNVGSGVQTAQTDAANAVEIARGLDTRITTEVGHLREEVEEKFVPVDGLQDLVRSFEIVPQVAEVGTQIEQWRTQVEQMQQEVDRLRTETHTVNTRVDNVILAAARGEVATQPAVEHTVAAPVATEQFVQVVESLKLAVESAATAKQREAVAENLVAVDEAMVQLTETPIAATEAPQVLGVLENLALAVRNAGASKARVTDVEANLDVLRTRFR